MNWEKEVLASPEGFRSPSDGIVTSPGPGQTAGGLIGFIITCLMVVVCLCFMIPLCLRWTFNTGRNLSKKYIN